MGSLVTHYLLNSFYIHALRFVRGRELSRVSKAVQMSPEAAPHMRPKRAERNAPVNEVLKRAQHPELMSGRQACTIRVRTISTSNQGDEIALLGGFFASVPLSQLQPSSVFRP
jgi:hypothetical protein